MLFFRYPRWKRIAKKALVEEKTCPCAACNDPIFPGDFVALTVDGNLVHAGFHYTLNEKNAFCITAAVGCGYWNGQTVENTLIPLAVKAIKTGTPQIGSY